jgi:hypothetical protein
MLPKAETRHPVRDLRGSVSAASRARPAKPDAPLDVGVMFGKLFAEQCVAIREQRQKNRSHVFLRTSRSFDIVHRSEVAAIAGLADGNPAWRLMRASKLEVARVGHPVRLIALHHLTLMQEHAWNFPSR